MPRKQTKILVSVLLLLDIASISAFIFLFSQTKSLIADSINGQNMIETELKKDDSRVLMKGDLAQGTIYQGKLTSYLVPSDGTIDFIKEIEKMVSDSGVKSDIKTVSTEAYDKGNDVGVEKLKVNMDVMGEWKNLQFFLAILENYTLEINIDRISFNKFSDYIIRGKKVPEWSGNFEFTVLKIKDVK